MVWRGTIGVLRTEHRSSAVPARTVQPPRGARRPCARTILAGSPAPGHAGGPPVWPDRCPCDAVRRGGSVRGMQSCRLRVGTRRTSRAGELRWFQCDHSQASGLLRRLDRVLADADARGLLRVRTAFLGHHPVCCQSTDCAVANLDAGADGTGHGVGTANTWRLHTRAPLT